MHAQAAAVPTTGRSDSRTRLIQLISEKCLLSKTDVQLASGAKSTFYFDMKPVEFDPEATNLISDLIIEVLDLEDVDIIGGLAVGAIPIIACVNQKSYNSNPIPGFFVRNEVKDHGTKRLVEGIPQGEDIYGKRAILVDDVTTTGNSVLIAVEAARGAGCIVDKVITVVDRNEGAFKNLADHGVELIALTTTDDYRLEL